MIDGTYRISMRTPEAVHDGAVVLTPSKDAVNANFVIDKVGSLESQGSLNGNEFTLSGVVNLYLVGRVNYRIDGLVAGDLLKATCATDRGTFDITGSRMN